MKILILNGPNLNLLGKREPEIYGKETLDELIANIKIKFQHIEILNFQSNHEGALIDRLHEQDFDGCVFNPGGYSHTSIALMDAIKSISKPVVEVHISDLSKREKFRQHSYTSLAAATTISGEGLFGYEKAINYLIDHKIAYVK